MAGGLWIAFFFNVLSSALRGLGDSKTPLYAMIASTALNIALDIILVMYTPLKEAGVALATLIAQAASCAYCGFTIRRMSEIRLRRSDFRFDRGDAAALMRLGLPMGFRNLTSCTGSPLNVSTWKYCCSEV
jgi:Na+-driven multidrug efflux pump